MNKNKRESILEINTCNKTRGKNNGGTKMMTNRTAIILLGIILIASNSLWGAPQSSQVSSQPSTTIEASSPAQFQAPTQAIEYQQDNHVVREDSGTQEISAQEAEMAARTAGIASLAFTNPRLFQEELHRLLKDWFDYMMDLAKEFKAELEEKILQEKSKPKTSQLNG